ncbi:MAG: hypothetical protein KC445_08325 [Anaerolineales bacterium]|nr:hypothetical protein [Anaerolineales bacterium]
MESVVHLSPTHILDERPFTHPDHVPGDLETLRYMASQLCLTLQNPHMVPDLPQTIMYNLPGQSSWFQRQVLNRPDHFKTHSLFHLVGFFGQSRSQKNIDLAQEFDLVLLAEIPQHEGLSSYCTMQLRDGNFANLVLFIDNEAQMHWSRSQAHAKAVYELSPGFYHSVRIYNGRLPHGIHQSDDMTLHKARYFDYDESPMWRAERTLA